MSGSDPSAPVRVKKWRSRRFTAIVVTITLAIAGVLGYVAYHTTQCEPSLVGCPPYPTLSIQSAQAQVAGFGPSTCPTSQYTAVCTVSIAGHRSGEVMLNVTFKVPQAGTYAGGVTAEFLVYSSASSYVNFSSIPSCAFTSGPSLDTRGCNVPANGSSEFQFNFT